MRRQRPRSALIPRHPLQRFLVRRFKPGQQPEPFEAQRIAGDSYWTARPVSPEEAADLLNRRRMNVRRAQFYRYDGHGIWASSWDGGREQVRTYMTPRTCRPWPTPCRIPLLRRRACA